MRDSAWRITWDPAGESPRVLLDFGDPMDDEIARTLAQVVDVGRFDQATNGKPYGRGNRKRRLSLTRTIDFSTALSAWQAMLGAMTSDPWASKALIRIQPRIGGSIFCRAALLGISRRPETQPWPGYSESVALRVDGGLTLSGSPLTVTGGWYNPPVVGGGTASGGITVVIVGTSTGLSPGDVVKLTGVPGVRDGKYQVTDVRTSGGNTEVDIDAGSDNRPRDEMASMQSPFASQLCSATYPLRILAYGCTDGADYSVKINGGTLIGLSAPLSGVRSHDGSAASSIDYANWFDPYSGGSAGPPPNASDPLPLDGTSGYPTGLTPPTWPAEITQSGPTSITVDLYRNGVLYDSQTVNPSWTSEVAYHPTIHDTTVDGLQMTINLNGPNASGRPRDATGVSERITTGTVEKAS